jgi:hypothetical protein
MLQLRHSPRDTDEIRAIQSVNDSLALAHPDPRRQT